MLVNRYYGIMNKLDQKIISLLGKNPAHPSEIARNLVAPRTTIQYRLRKMERSGIVKNSKLGKKTIWELTFKNLHDKNHFRIYKGIESYQAYKQILDLPKNSIILVIQGSKAAEKEFSCLPEIFIKEVHRTLKKKTIILKGLSNKKSLDLFDAINGEIVDSHIGRPLGVKFLFGDIFCGSGEIMSTRKKLLLSNPEAKRTIVIKDRAIAKIIHETLQLLFEMMDGYKVFDLNQFLRTKKLPNKTNQ